MRPVVGIRLVRSRTLRARRPGRPPEERRKLVSVWPGQTSAPCGIAYSCAAVAEHVSIISSELLEGRGLILADNHAIRRRIISIRAHLPDQPRLEHRLLVKIECGKVRCSHAVRPAVQQNFRFAMQPVRAPVRRNIRAVTPHSADLLPANRLPNALSIGNRTAGKQKLSIRRVDIRNRRSLTDHLPSNGSKNGE